MDYKDHAERIIELRTADFRLRGKLAKSGQLGKGYNEAMEKLHNKNAGILNEASEAAWLVIQHSIGQPNFMKKCNELLEKAVSENKANPVNLAYLTDRIAQFEEEPQLYGTQFDWDENGELSPNKFDDIAKVNQRRKSIGLNSLEEQTAIIRRRAKKENQTPPTNFEKRKEEMDKWRKSVGWIK